MKHEGEPLEELALPVETDAEWCSTELAERIRRHFPVMSPVHRFRSQPYERSEIPEAERQRAIAELQSQCRSWNGMWVVGKLRSAALHATWFQFRTAGDPDELIREAGLGAVLDRGREPASHGGLAPARNPEGGPAVGAEGSSRVVGSFGARH